MTTTVPGKTGRTMKVFQKDLTGMSSVKNDMEKRKKALLVTTVSGFVPQFEMDNVRILQEMGFEVHYASNYRNPSYGNDNHRLDGTGIIRHQIDFVRSPFDPANGKVYRQLCALMYQQQFDLIHCHTPMGGVMARLAARMTGTGPVIYTAHGFHFFKGASAVNWLCYYPIEKFLSWFTEQQICINREDYQRAKRKFHARYVNYIPGAGLDNDRISRMTKQEAEQKKAQLGLLTDRRILLSSGELIKRKNHESMIRAIAEYKKACICGGYGAEAAMNFVYIICGHGALEQKLRSLAESLKVADVVKFLGYREDIMDIYRIADVYIFPSYQEGLPMALLEAMASGLPVLCSDIRGSRDLMGKPISQTSCLEYCRGGIMVKRADDIKAYQKALKELLSADAEKLTRMGEANVTKSRKFDRTAVHERMEKIYRRLAREEGGA